MSAKVFRQVSKEFQMKVVWPPAGQQADLAPGITDQQIFQHVTKTISEVVTRLAKGDKQELVFQNKPWRREGIRFDSADRELKRHNLTLAIEATDEKTKLKCKQHHFIPELLFAKPKDSVCLPNAKAARSYKEHSAKFKLEEDLHYSNIKYCASGSLFVKGRSQQVSTIDYFSRYFPSLDRLLPASTPLEPLSHWDEAVYDEMITRWGKYEFSDWMLVNRWAYGSNTLLESELSFKVDIAMNDDWDHKRLYHASQLYLELQRTGIFRAAPPIFFYDNPVSSTDIEVVNK
jgi:hypothetical protein